MSFLWRWTKRLLALLLVLVIALAAPVVYVETMCRGEGSAATYAALIDGDHHRAESRTLMTYPEWHIVHAYEDYAKVLETSDPHDYGFAKGIGGFWTSLCALSRSTAELGEIDGATKQMVYVIGVSFTAELALKALYEETLGRLFATLRGQDRSPLDNLSADQAADYAAFLRQVPWYKWRFLEDAADLDQKSGESLRDRERRIALGLEYRAKAAYADLIAQAVAQVGPDQLTLRLIITGPEASELSRYDDLSLIQERPEGLEVEAPRYRVLTHLLQDMARNGFEIVEIAGNDDILFTALSDSPTEEGALFSAPRQGFGDHRHLIMVKVRNLAQRLRQMEDSGLRLEHIHDY